LTNVEKLVQAGFAVQPTMSGLAITPPPELGFDDKTDIVIAMMDYFQAAGIDEDCECFATRTLAEVYAAEEECWDRIWYEEKRGYLADPAPDPKATASDIAGLLACMRHLEDGYGADNLHIADDVEWGVLHGRLSALKWVQGDCSEELVTKRRPNDQEADEPCAAADKGV
jgi:hypothetical protein